jgi:RNA polymerase sigma-70 factor (ECF subfamily)
MVAVISKLYGLQHMEMAEDIVSETFLVAAETWGLKGMPENPAAWLYAVAKQKTLYQFRRNKIFTQKIARELKSQQTETDETEELNFSLENIKDSQLQMMFAICNPSIASEAQIGLALRILCGFSIDEIAEAFLTNKETINKRLFRAKEKLRTEKVKMEFPAESELRSRLDNVLHVIYLLFNEGYYSTTQNQILRKDFCLEAMRLGLILTEYEKTNLPKTNALMALMCFHASRFEARHTREDLLVLYDEQDESLWNKELINQGTHYLALSAEGSELSSYHLEARIAYWHCRKEDSKEKWKAILDLYDRLLLVNPSPNVSLNRIYALYKANQDPDEHLAKQLAVVEAVKLNLEHNHFYYLLLGELYKGIDNKKARANLEKAHSLAKTQTEQEGIQKKMESLV